MSSTKQILVKIIYSYYTRKRATPFFLTEEEIISNDFYSFKERIINEVPHLAKANAPLQLTVLDGNLEVDLSPAYFEMQIRDLLVKRKELTIQTIVFESPASGITKEKNDNAVSRNVTNTNTPVKRSLQLYNDRRRRDVDSENEENSIYDMPDDIYEMPNDNISDFDDDENDEDNEVRGDRTQLYVSPVDKIIQSKRQEIQRQENKISTKVDNVRALEESFTTKTNDSTRPACSKCHLRLGHTRPLCPNDVCTSARLCGELKKHPEEKKQIKDAKSELQVLKNTKKKLKDELDSLQENIKSSKRTFSQLIHSDLINSNKKKYITIVNDREIINWMQLNSDAKKIEKICGGKVPDAHRNLQDLIKEHDRLELEHPNTSNFKPTKTNKQVKQLWEKKGVVFPGSGPMYEPNEYKQRLVGTPVPNSTEEEEYQINLAIRESNRYNTEFDCARQNIGSIPFDMPFSTSNCSVPWSRNSSSQSASVYQQNYGAFQSPSVYLQHNYGSSQSLTIPNQSVRSMPMGAETYSRTSIARSINRYNSNPFQAESTCTVSNSMGNVSSHDKNVDGNYGVSDMGNVSNRIENFDGNYDVSTDLNESFDENCVVYADETPLTLLANAVDIVESDQRQ